MTKNRASTTTAGAIKRYAVSPFRRPVSAIRRSSSAPARTSWAWSRRNAYSGRQESSTASPYRKIWSRPVFCANTVSSCPHGILTRYCVLTPMKLTSVTTPPGMVLPGASSSAPGAPISTFSGRMPIHPLPPSVCALGVGIVTSIPCMSTVTRSADVDFTVPSTRLDWPRKFATKVLRGFS